jgi:hypothetical protein
MPRLRQLSEAECYARCYGALGSGDVVRVVRVERPRPRDFATGELLRSVLEAKLDAREPEAA